jgi:hypothetical protein
MSAGASAAGARDGASETQDVHEHESAVREVKQMAPEDFVIYINVCRFVQLCKAIQ